MKPVLMGLLLAVGLVVALLLAQPVASGTVASGTTLAPTPVASVAFGGGEFAPGPLDEISPTERAAIEAMIAANIARLTQQGRDVYKRQVLT